MVYNLEVFVKKLSTYKLMNVISVLLLLSLLPLFELGSFAFPAADDFSYGAPAHLAYQESGSFLSAAAAALDKTVESYFSWQGSFAAIFLMALQPAVFSEALYALTPYIMLLSYIASSFVFCRALFSELMGLDRHLARLAASLLCFVGAQLMPSPVQGLYWFNGSVYYMFFHALLLTGCALGITILLRGGGWRIAALCLVCFLIGGGNYVTALSALIVAFFAIALLAAFKNCGWKKLALPFLVLTFSFALNAAAPGNAVRQAAQSDTPGALKAVLMSFGCGAEYALGWMSLPVLGMLLLVAFVFFAPVGKCSFSFRAPALVTLFSYCLFSAMFCPPLYAMGNVGDKRLLNIVYLSYLLLLLINLIYWLGWLAKRSGIEVREYGFGALAFGVAAFGMCCGMYFLQGGSFSSAGALSCRLSGEAAAYRDCAQRRFDILYDESISDAELEPFPCQPYLLYFDDITEDPQDWRNVDMSSYFGKNSVVLK